MVIKGFQQWINENSETPNQETPEILRHLFDLGMIDHAEFAKSTKRVNPTGWIGDLLKELESRHLAEPDIWGKPVEVKSPYHTIGFTLSSDLVNMPSEHYDNYSYELLLTEPILVVVYLNLAEDSSLELRATYANSDFAEQYGEDEDQYDATWSYHGSIPILEVDDILTIIDGFNSEVNDDTIEDSADWSHD
jgi:hypothetical protein